MEWKGLRALWGAHDNLAADSRIAPVNDLPWIPPARIDELLQRGEAVWRAFEARTGPRHHLFVPCDQRAAYEALRRLRDSASTFLEFGSAAGVVTILADWLGFEACGIEIEPWLVEQSTALARQLRSGATFVEGTFVPPDYQDDVQLLTPDRLTPTGGADAYEELGMSLRDFDVVFAYPWPGEEEWLFELMRRHARPRARLLTYDANDGCTVTEVREL